MLIANRPIATKALGKSIPDNFTVMTAAAGDQTAKPLEEVKHGILSYFLTKGMEGEADAHKNNKRPFSPFFEVVRFRWVRGYDFLEYGTKSLNTG
ncbi:MAG: Uncharacterised protein [Rhodospirillaceae bacterium]|nr:MAG: Uncharacterised protein [Rhodospirillaceae bacterium]